MLPVAALFADGEMPQRVMDGSSGVENHANRRKDGEQRRYSRQRVLRQPGESAACQYQS